jgi:hypothetical protein
LWIYNNLKSLNLPSEIFRYRRNGEDYYNLYCHLRSSNRTAQPILVTAHWDVVDANSDNCLDNTASLFNLVELARKLNSVEKNRDIILAWTDLEESVSTYFCGAVEAVRAYQPEYMLDLELTACGTNILTQTYGEVDFRVPDQPIEAAMPCNNAAIVWRSGQSSTLRGTACLTLVTDEELQGEIAAGEYCKRWWQCHKDTDSFDNWLRLDDMDKFTDKMVELVLSLHPRHNDSMSYKGIYEGKHWQYDGYTLFCQNEQNELQACLREHSMSRRECEIAVKSIVDGRNQRREE